MWMIRVKLKTDKEYAITQGQRGTKCANLFLGDATYLDRTLCRRRGTGDPDEKWDVV